MWEFEVESGPFSRCTDGLLPEYAEKTPESWFGTAVLILLPDQSVEPLSLDLALGHKARGFRAARIRFGWRDWKYSLYGDSRHSKMAALLATMPRSERDWLWTFTLLRGDWSAQAPSAARNPLLWPPIAW